ncbi:MAG: hypothetical protein QXL17_00315 [Candidatus Thermoplasmatota archaeon]
MSRQTKKSQKKTTTKQAMNEALKQWLSETDQQILSQKIEHHLEGRKPEGMCRACGVNQAKAICIKCGNSVCISCYYSIIGLCRNCISKETVNQWKAKKPNWKTILGVDWVDE